MNTIDPDDRDIRDYLRELYGSFEDGFVFEEFLKGLLLKMGLQDVTVTQKSNDGGIDLTAMRPGLDTFSRIDEVAYKVQAKRYAPERAVGIEKVRALRGVLSHHEKGLFITTGTFGTNARAFAVDDQSRPLVLIDGSELVQLCIQHGIGFRFRPVFDQRLLGLTGIAISLAADPSLAEAIKSSMPGSSDERRFLKTITANDIRARIISVPRALGEQFKNADTLNVEFPPFFSPSRYPYRPDRMFISSVTSVLDRFGMRGQDGLRNPRAAEWIVRPATELITVQIQPSAIV
jgi:restriction system protein